MVLVELMGLPGAGKSTVYAGLLRERPAIVTIPILSRRPYAATLARHLLGAAGTLVRRRALSREWSPRLVIMMAYVRALPPALAGRHAPSGAVLLFDQGPIYTLMRGPLRHERLASWWAESLESWRGLLDVVVWLDAPSGVLAGRIDSRDEPHRLKGVGHSAALAGLARDREVYERVLSQLEAGPGGPVVLRFDTSRMTGEEVVAAVLEHVGAP